MANQTQKTSKLLWLAISVVGGVGLIYAYQPDDTTSTAHRAAPKAAAKKVSADGLTEADYTAHFPELKVAAKDSFKPVIAGPATGSPLSLANIKIGIPTSMTSGEQNWQFTGTAALNGTQMALFENSTTHQGDYVRIGQHWKSCQVMGMDDSTVTLLSDTGDKETVTLQSIEEALLAQAQGAKASSMPAAAPPQPTGPVNPMVGPIGGELQVQPDPNAMPSDAAPAMAAPAPFGGNRGGRGGRGGRGRRFTTTQS